MQKFFDFNKKIAEANWFQTFIILVIIIAGILVGMQTYRDSAFVIEWTPLFHKLDMLILIIFTIEVVVKMLAEGKKPWRYFLDGWNVFDFLIVAVALYAILPGVEINASFIAVLRLARIFRVFKLVTAIPKLQLLVGALIKSIPSMGYVGILLSILFYIYAAMGVEFFGENDPIHFGTLHDSMLSLFRIVTLEDWTDIMYINIFGCDHPIWGYEGVQGLLTQYNMTCDSPQAFRGGAAAYFISFVLIGTMIVLNLFIGVIMNSMDEAKAEAEMDANIQAKKAGNVTLSQELHILTSKIDELKTEMDFVYNKIKKEEEEK
ncbi:MAG: ion transporter [Chitinophagales bacterium]